MTFAYTVGFIGDFAVPKTIDMGTDGRFIQALLVDLSLVVLFGLQHSLMARPTFKRMLTRFIPTAAERSTFVLASSVVLLLIIWLWQPVPQVVWSVHDLVGITISYTVFMLGWVLVLVSTFLIDHFDFAGLAQVYAYLHGKAYQPPSFKTPLFYQYVRHPIMIGLLIGMWVAPQMTVGHLLFAASMTLYILIGITLEERDLMRFLGEAYEDYRARTSMFLPLPRRMGRKTALLVQTAETVRSRLLRLLFNWWPALRGAGMRVTYVAPEMLEIHVSLSPTFHTLNPMAPSLAAASMRPAIRGIRPS
jgi:protein-S-isoprenylcysteine O-methyltransferase Ste14